MQAPAPPSPPCTPNPAHNLCVAQAEATSMPSAAGQVSMFAAMKLLKGSVYESQENWPLAARCYTAALQAEPLCYEV